MNSSSTETQAQRVAALSSDMTNADNITGARELSDLADIDKNNNNEARKRVYGPTPASPDPDHDDNSSVPLDDGLTNLYKCSCGASFNRWAQLDNHCHPEDNGEESSVTVPTSVAEPKQEKDKSVVLTKSILWPIRYKTVREPEMDPVAWDRYMASCPQPNTESASSSNQVPQLTMSQNQADKDKIEFMHSLSLCPHSYLPAGDTSNPGRRSWRRRRRTVRYEAPVAIRRTRKPRVANTLKKLNTRSKPRGKNYPATRSHALVEVLCEEQDYKRRLQLDVLRAVCVVNKLTNHKDPKRIRLE